MDSTYAEVRSVTITIVISGFTACAIIYSGHSTIGPSEYSCIADNPKVTGVYAEHYRRLINTLYILPPYLFAYFGNE